MAGKKVTEKAFNLLKKFPRVSLGNLKDLPDAKPRRVNRRRSREKAHTHGRGMKGQGQRMTLPRLGFEGNNTPFYLQIPKEPYYKSHHLRREYLPVSLLQLQRLIDLKRVDPSQPIDTTSLINTGLFKVEPEQRQFGFNLTEEGVDIFASQINIEIGWTTETVIAAIERNGGVVTTRYFDPLSLQAIVCPLKFFLRGKPIPRCKLPPQDAIEYYTDPTKRGYLADPEKVQEARIELAQKYGYNLPELVNDPNFEMLSMKKDPRQIFYGLEPGWVVNLKDKCVLKPKGELYQKFYGS